MKERDNRNDDWVEFSGVFSTKVNVHKRVTTVNASLYKLGKTSFSNSCVYPIDVDKLQEL